MKTRTLTLRREALTVLSDEELQAAAGAATQVCVTRQPTLCYICQLLTDDVC